MWGKKGEQHPNFGRQLTDHQKNVISYAAKKRWENKEWVENIMESVYKSEHFKTNISNAQKNSWQKDEVRLNHAKSQTKELKENQSVKMKDRWENEQFRRLMYDKRSGECSVNYGKEGNFKGKEHTSETKSIMSESAKKSWTKERREKASQTQSISQKGLGLGFKNNNSIVIHDTITGKFYMTRKKLFEEFYECKMTDIIYKKFIYSGRFLKTKKKEYDKMEIK